MYDKVSIEYEKWSTEEKLRQLRRAFPLWIGIIVKAVDEKLGEEGRKVIMDALRYQGFIHGQKVIVDKRHAERSIQGVIQAFLTNTQAMGDEPDIIEVSQNRIVMRFNHCAMADRWKMIKAPSWICEVWGSYALGMYQAVHPKFQYTRLTSIMRGDSYCEEVWEIKE